MSDLDDLDDPDLVSAALGGNSRGFETLYARYLKRIYNLVYRMVGPQEAEEVTQEAFMQAYRNLKKFRGESQFYTWLYRVASNTALQFLRKKGRREKRSSSFEDLQENAPGVLPDAAALSVFDDPQKAAESSELQRHVREVMETLPPNQKMVLLLGPLQGMSYEEMATALDASVPIVKARLHRARENLRERVAARYHGNQPPPDPDTSLLVKEKKPRKGEKGKRRKKAAEPAQERGPPEEGETASHPPDPPGASEERGAAES